MLTGRAYKRTGIIIEKTEATLFELVVSCKIHSYWRKIGGMIKSVETKRSIKLDK